MKWIHGIIGIVVSTQLLAVAAAPAFKEGQGVEVREGDQWSSATFEKQEGRKFQIRYSDGTEEWVTADRVRAAGGAATDAPASPPAETHTAGSAISLDGPFTVINLQAGKKIPTRASVSLVLPPTTRPSAAFTDLTPSVEPGLKHIEKLIVCADRPGTFVVVGQTQEDDTPLLCMDINNPSVAETRVFSAHECRVVAATADAAWLLTAPKAFSAHTLNLWQYVDGTYQLKSNYTFAGERGNKEPSNPILLSPTRLIVQTFPGETYLIDLPSKHQVAFLKCGDITVHPSTKFLESSVDGNAVMLRTTDLAIIGQATGRALKLGIDSTGTMEAGLENHTVSVVKLPSKQPIAHMGGVSNANRIDLLSANALLVDGQIYYDLKTGIPVWKYEAPNTESVLLANGQMLYVGSEDNQTIVCMAALPTPDAEAALTSASADKFVLKPGAHIAISGDLGAFGDADKAKKNIEQSLTAAGHKSDDTAAQYKLTVASAAGPTGKFDTRLLGMMGPVYKEVDAPSTIVTLTLTSNGDAIWKRDMKFSAEVMVRRRMDESLEQAVADAAKPDPGRLAGLDVPGFIVKGSDPTKLATLGESKLTRQGFVAAEPKAN